MTPTRLHELAFLFVVSGNRYRVGNTSSRIAAKAASPNPMSIQFPFGSIFSFANTKATNAAPKRAIVSMKSSLAYAAITSCS